MPSKRKLTVSRTAESTTEPASDSTSETATEPAVASDAATANDAVKESAAGSVDRSVRKPADKVNERVSRYRVKSTVAGSRRVEVTIPEQDVRMIKSVAKLLRDDDDNSRTQQLRATLAEIITHPVAVSGGELIEFFRSAPVELADLGVPEVTAERQP